jgi:YesN/AraC family two-component response regulator
MLKILLVEDDERFRTVLKEDLIDSFPSVTVEEASDGKEAMEKTNSFCPQLIFMDIRLPGESGLQLARRIKTKWPDIRVAMLTSYDSPEYRQAAMEHGASHYIVKGGSEGNKIRELVESLLDKSKDPAENL